jgi:beta-galactosidase
MKVVRIIAVSCLLMLAVLSPASAEEIAFNSQWQFYRVDGNQAPATPPARADWQKITLPHTTRIEPRIVVDQWQGIAFFRRHFDAPAAWHGKTVLLRFEAAMNIASVSVNGRPVARHLGGYLPFTIDLTSHLRLGRSNEILVRLDNRDSPITGPKPLKGLDFNTYGGLYRGVRLFVKPPVHLSDEMLADKVAGGGLFVTYPEASSERAVVAIAADVRNASASAASATVTHRLYDGSREIARSADTLQIDRGAIARNAQQLTVRLPRLWSPRSPNLYRLVTTISTPDTQDDTTETRIGIRRTGFDGSHFVINGERMFLRGVNRHQEYPYVGYALSPQADYRDAKLIKEAGFDYVRLSHYPHSPAFMRAADELGLMLLDALPGWQFYNPDPQFQAQVLQTCRDMIRRDRNHPSVLAWECSLNESTMPPAFVAKLNRAVHEEYPGDQAWSAGWLAEGFDIYLQARQHRLQHYETPDRPYIVSEYGDWEYYAENAGLNQTAWADLKQEERTSRQALGVGEKRLLQQVTNIQEAHNDNFSTPAFADGYWAMFDYNRGYADDLETSGIMSLERLPKFSYFFFRSQRDPKEVSPLFRSGPMVKIASYWDAQSSTVLRVFSNAEEVELLLNGRSLGRKRPHRGKNSDRLAHPPFLFDAGRFEPGVLEARGFIDGREVAVDRVRTPEAPHHLVVALDAADVPVVEGDLVFARAHVRDCNGQPVPTHNGTARFSASGDLEIVGPADVPVEAGIASALIRVKRALPLGSIEASSGDLVPGSSGVLLNADSEADAGLRRASGGCTTPVDSM